MVGQVDLPRVVRGWLVAVVLAVVAMRPAVARASPVNSEQLRPDLGSTGWSGLIDGRAAVSRGNVDRLDLGWSSGVQYLRQHDPERVGRARPGAPSLFRDRFMLLADFAFGRVSGSNFLDRGFAHARYTRMFILRVGLTIFAQVQYDQILRLRARFVGGAGPRFVLVNLARVQSWAATAAMAEYEVNDTVPGDPHPARVLAPRWSSYWTLQLTTPGEGAGMLARNTIYAQPRFDRPADVRVLENLQLEVSARPWLALGASLLVQWDSMPPQAVQRLDLTLGSYLRVRLRDGSAG